MSNLENEFNELEEKMFLLCRGGFTQKYISEKLGVSVKTVRKVVKKRIQEHEGDPNEIKARLSLESLFKS